MAWFSPKWHFVQASPKLKAFSFSVSHGWSPCFCVSILTKEKKADFILGVPRDLLASPVHYGTLCSLIVWCALSLLRTHSNISLLYFMQWQTADKLPSSQSACHGELPLEAGISTGNQSCEKKSWRAGWSLPLAGYEFVCFLSQHSTQSQLSHHLRIAHTVATTFAACFPTQRVELNIYVWNNLLEWSLSENTIVDFTEVLCFAEAIHRVMCFSILYVFMTVLLSYST